MYSGMTSRDESIHDDGRPCRYVAGACNLCGATEPGYRRGSSMTLLELIEAFGQECTYGGQGYTADHSEELLDEIKKRIKEAEEDGGGAL